MCELYTFFIVLIRAVVTGGVGKDKVRRRSSITYIAHLRHAHIGGYSILLHGNFKDE